MVSIIKKFGKRVLAVLLIVLWVFPLIQVNAYIAGDNSDDVLEDIVLEEQSVPVVVSEGTLEVGDEFIDGKFKYRIITEGEVEIFPTTYLPNGDPTVTDIIIPQTATYGGENYLVTQIGWRAFMNYGHLENVIMPNSITRIEQFAFLGCSALKNINISDGLTYIESYAFEGCHSLTSIDLPDGITDIGASAFKNCSNLTSIDIPDSLSGIEWDTFRECISLKSVNIPDGVTFIGPNAFQGCSTLSEVVIPSSVTYIGGGAFQDCSDLTQVVISEGVTKIYSDAFKGCNSLSSVDIPDGMQEISASAFDCDIKYIRFKGDVPSYWCAYDMFGREGREIIAYYPINNDTWTEEVKQNISSYANITWIPWDPGTGEGFVPGSSNPGGIIPSDASFSLFLVPEYSVYEEDMILSFWGTFKATQEGNINEEAEAIVWESSDPLIADINHVSYDPNPNMGNLYGYDNTDTLATVRIYLDCYKPGIVTITGTSADGRSVSATMTIEPPLIAGEATRVMSSSNVMLCKVELSEKTDEELAFLQTFLESLVVKGMNWDLNSVFLSDDDFMGLYTKVNADSVNGIITLTITSPGGQVVEIDLITNTVVYYDDNNRKSVTFKYSLDSCLEKDATIYNPDLAYMLAALANSAYHKEGLNFTLLKDAKSGTFPVDPLVITESLRNLGFDAENGDVREFNYYSSSLDSNYSDDTTAFTLATKDMSDGTKLVCIVVRGSYGDIYKFTSDWQSNVNFKNQGVGLHEGFNAAANEIIQELNTFKTDKAISDNNVVYVITGHSRGAAVANLVAKKLIDNGVPTNNVYDYNFACPDSGRDYASNWNLNGKYDSLYNINNVRDIVGIIPGNLFNSSLNINSFLFSGELGIVFWGKYGHTYFFAENWDTVIETMIGGFDQHNATLYLDYMYDMSKKQSTVSYKSWEQARITLVENAAKETGEKLGKIFGVFCPVDFEIIDKDGVKIAEVVNGQPQYYLESLGDVIIVTAGDQSLVYVNGRNDYFVKFTGYANGEMTYCVSDAVLGSEYGKEIQYTNVQLSQGKTMVSILDSDEQSDKVTLVLFDEDLNPEKQIDCDGTEQELSDDLEKEYSNLPLGNTTTQYKITYNLGGGQVTGNPTTYTKGTDTFTLKNPTRSGYTFTGWTGSNGNTPELTVTITQGTTGDLSYTANWEKNSSGTNNSSNGGTATTNGTGNSNGNGTNSDTSTNTNTNKTIDANITNTNSLARDSVPDTGDSANIAVPLIIISILAFGIAYVHKNSITSSNRN